MSESLPPQEVAELFEAPGGYILVGDDPYGEWIESNVEPVDLASVV